MHPGEKLNTKVGMFRERKNKITGKKTHLLKQPSMNLSITASLNTPCNCELALPAVLALQIDRKHNSN